MAEGRRQGRALGRPRPRPGQRARLLRLARLRSSAGGVDPGAARLLRCTYLSAYRRRRCVPYALVGRPVRGRNRARGSVARQRAESTMSIEDSYNFRRIHERLTTSGLVSAEQLNDLQNEGYDAVINLLPES